jgi:hypothetical protein
MNDAQMQIIDQAPSTSARSPYWDFFDEACQVTNLLGWIAPKSATILHKLLALSV